LSFPDVGFPPKVYVHSWKEVILEHGTLLVYLSIRQRDTRTQACKERDCDTSRYRVHERYITSAARSEIDRLWPRRKVNPALGYNSFQLRPQRRTAIREHGAASTVDPGSTINNCIARARKICYRSQSRMNCIPWSRNTYRNLQT